MRKKYSHYEYSTEYLKGVCLDPELEGWDYAIHTNDQDFKFWMRTDICAESDELYETKEEAEQAAKDRIDRLESGEQ